MFPAASAAELAVCLMSMERLLTCFLRVGLAHVADQTLRVPKREVTAPLDYETRALHVTSWPLGPHPHRSGRFDHVRKLRIGPPSRLHLRSAHGVRHPPLRRFV